MISALNFKPYERGSIKGFFDLRYHGLTIKGCRLMNGNNGLWFAFPQLKVEEDGETQYYDQMFVSSLEREHIRKLVLLDLESQGHIKGQPKPKRPPKQRNFEGEDLSGHYSPPGENIPF